MTDRLAVATSDVVAARHEQELGGHEDLAQPSPSLEGLLCLPSALVLLTQNETEPTLTLEEAVRAADPDASIASFVPVYLHAAQEQYAISSPHGQAEGTSIMPAARNSSNAEGIMQAVSCCHQADAAACGCDRIHSASSMMYLAEANQGTATSEPIPLHEHHAQNPSGQVGDSHRVGCDSRSRASCLHSPESIGLDHDCIVTCTGSNLQGKAAALAACTLGGAVDVVSGTPSGSACESASPLDNIVGDTSSTPTGAALLNTSHGKRSDGSLPCHSQPPNVAALPISQAENAAADHLLPSGKTTQGTDTSADEVFMSFLLDSSSHENASTPSHAVNAEAEGFPCSGMACQAAAADGGSSRPSLSVMNVAHGPQPLNAGSNADCVDYDYSDYVVLRMSAVMQPADAAGVSADTATNSGYLQGDVKELLVAPDLAFSSPLYDYSITAHESVLDSTDNGNDEANGDDDEDQGIYDESYRSSKWIFIGTDGTLSDAMEQPDAGAGYQEASDTPLVSAAPRLTQGQPACESPSDCIASVSMSKSDDMPPQMDTSGKALSLSSETDSFQDASKVPADVERRGIYRSISCKTVQRHSSLEVFHRETTKIIEPEKTAVLTRASANEDYGFHIKGSHPIVVTLVTPGSLADDAGVDVGDVLLAVNYQSVLSLTHEQTLELILSDSLTLILELCSKLEGLVTGSVPLLLYSQPEVLPMATTIHSGYLSKVTGLLRLWRRFWFVLKPDNCLYYYKNDVDREPLGAIPLSGYTLCRSTDMKKEYTLKLMNSSSTYYLAGESESDISRWAELLNRSCRRDMSVHDVWLEMSTHNVSLPALAIKSPDCHGQLTKMGGKMKTWRRRYCVLKDGCLYYYINMSSTSAQGVAHLHGYSVDSFPQSSKKNAFSLVPPNPKMRTFCFYADSDFEKERWVRSMTLSIGRWARMDGCSMRRSLRMSIKDSIPGTVDDSAIRQHIVQRPNDCSDREWMLIESRH